MHLAVIWLVKLILAHLLTDFIFQPTAWIEQRKRKHYASPLLYLHGFITGIVALIFIGFQYWLVALVIMITHTIIDGWKSYQKEVSFYFLLDQAMHIAIILGCWYFTFYNWQNMLSSWQAINTNVHLWMTVTSIVFLTFPAGILIGQLTKQWREQIIDAESLANAGKWIGIIERIIILLFVLKNDYSAIGLLVAAKGIIRFNEKDRPEIKTEYLVIGTLMSIGISLVTGLLLKYLV